MIEVSCSYPEESKGHLPVSQGPAPQTKHEIQNIYGGMLCYPYTNTSCQNPRMASRRILSWIPDPL